MVAADEDTVSGNYTIKDGTLTIADETFYCCNSLESVTVPNGVRNIGDYAFQNCEKLKSVTIPNGVTRIGKNAFEYCKKLESITIPNGVTSIGDFTFCGCTVLKSVTIPGSITSIGYRVFEHCSDELVIYGTEGSYSEEYANDYDIKFVDKNHTCKSFKTTTAKATFSKNGKTIKTCKICQKTATTVTIYKVSSVKLSATSYTYNGKVRKPTVTVKNSNGKKLTPNKDYTLTYANGRKNVGKYTVKVTLKGNYSGSKTITFKINPKATKLNSVTAGKKKITVKWNKQSTQTDGYQIQYSTSSAFKNAKTVTVTNKKTTSKTISRLNGGKKYYVRVRTYKTVKNTKYYSSWSAKKSATTKK